MSEEKAIQAEAKTMQGRDLPLTCASLAAELRTCGLAEGQTVLVHMAMSQLGWIAGGAQTVVDALLEVLGTTGTLMMPTHTTSNTDPAEWQHPPVPEHWWQIIREQTTPYDPARTPTRLMGAVAELFRTYPNVIRSSHPVTSFAAHGVNAELLIHDHHLEHDTGEQSPLGRLYDLDGHVLLLGVEHWNNTSLHLAEARANYLGKQYFRTGTAMLVNGKREWVWYETLKTYGDDFGEIGKAFDTESGLTIPKIGNAEVRFFKQRSLVDFAVKWMEEHRDLRDKAAE